jgi:hypothetical protein
MNKAKAEKMFLQHLFNVKTTDEFETLLNFVELNNFKLERNKIMFMIIQIEYHKKDNVKEIFQLGYNHWSIEADKHIFCREIKKGNIS